MAAPYATYFDNLFVALRMSRPAYKAQATYALLAVRQANLGAAFTPLLEDLERATGSFDENLTDRLSPTAGETDAYQLVRQTWLTFVDDAMKDYVTPKLRKLPMYADFKKLSKSKLATLKQDELVLSSQKLVDLYAKYLDLLKAPSLATDAAQVLKAVADADETRDESEAAADETILDLADDRAAIARAERRLKAQLELTFDESKKVYSFFDFSAAKINKSGKVKVIKQEPKA